VIIRGLCAPPSLTSVRFLKARWWRRKRPLRYILHAILTLLLFIEY